jgi:hypothetical protein
MSILKDFTITNRNNDSMNAERILLTRQLIELLTKGNAHVTFDQAVANISLKNLSIKPNNLPYNIWMLVEHIRITQADILDFSINSNYKELKWPGEYWPTAEMPEDEHAWQKSLEQIRQDRDRFIDLLNKQDVDLLTPFAHGNGQNLLREAMLIADHNSYHTGEIVLIRRMLNDWQS